MSEQPSFVESVANRLAKISPKRLLLLVLGSVYVMKNLYYMSQAPPVVEYTLTEEDKRVQAEYDAESNKSMLMWGTFCLGLGVLWVYLKKKNEEQDQIEKDNLEKEENEKILEAIKKEERNEKALKKSSKR